MSRLVITQVRSKIGFMAGNTGIYDRMTASEMVAHFGRLYGIEEDDLQHLINVNFSTPQMN